MLVITGKAKRFKDRKPPPLTVAAPIVTDATSKKGVQPLLDFVASLQAHSNTKIAAAESKRLEPYFSAMSHYLSSKAPADKKVQKLTTPGSLSGIFNAMASCTRTTLISDVAILPDNIAANRYVKPLFKEDQFAQDFHHKNLKMNFGFLQVYQTTGKEVSSVSFPTFMLDADVLDCIRIHGAMDMLKDLQSVMTFVNHDMLHHFTSPLINPAVAHKAGRYNAKPMDLWGDDLENNAYESWAHVGHEHTLLAPENAGLVEEVKEKVFHYFEEMEKFVVALEAKCKEAELEDDPETLGRLSVLVDYCGIIMAHSLSRIFPLDHEVMGICFDNMQRLDPLSGDSVRNKERREELISGISPQVYFTVVIEYKEKGYDIYDPKKMTDYRAIKSMELINLSYPDILPHIPSDTLNWRKTADDKTLDMLLAAAKTSGYKP